MISDFTYLVGWSVYILAAAGCMLVWWRMTHSVKMDGLREILRLLAFVILFTPWYADPRQSGQDRDAAASSEIVLEELQRNDPSDVGAWLAPAVIIALLEGIFDGPAHMVRGLRPILFTSLAGLLLLVPYQLLRTWSRRRAAAHG